ncbi:hypothetical protein BURMUCF1_1213, partial [Burkholderia multivorans ATCC BAA-247]
MQPARAPSRATPESIPMKPNTNLRAPRRLVEHARRRALRVLAAALLALQAGAMNVAHAADAPP